MKFFTVFSAILASGTAMAASVPNTRGLSSTLATRNVEVQASPETRDVKDDITSFFDSIIPTSDEKSQTPEGVEKRDVLENIVGGVKGLVPGANASQQKTDYNKLINHGYNVTAEYFGSVDLNAKANVGIEWAIGKITTTIPGASIFISLLSGFKIALGKLDLNAWASSALAIVGKFVSSTDFNAAITAAIKFCENIASQVSAASASASA
ncbi:uncharacterized protein FIESC28_00065 [Fusarium coffeatum]|uniref:Uncharacterized protein n=1 Tax=Fusarium coffeatum TaxID=231269 RepID=A0A366SCS5_9HYPO|nr:uncharacterized protein FIESC28_00065 [Fusarium coffeatum]RBR27121.1 hypothetical protein FIESC28_00065 [Fusarium coffeatum]